MLPSPFLPGDAVFIHKFLRNERKKKKEHIISKFFNHFPNKSKDIKTFTVTTIYSLIFKVRHLSEEC